MHLVAIFKLYIYLKRGFKIYQFTRVLILFANLKMNFLPLIHVIHEAVYRGPEWNRGRLSWIRGAVTFWPRVSFIRSEPEIGPRGNEIIFESVVILVLDIAWQERYSTRRRRGCARKRGSKKVRKLVTRPGFRSIVRPRSPPVGERKKEEKRGKNGEKGGEGKRKICFPPDFRWT